MTVSPEQAHGTEKRQALSCSPPPVPSVCPLVEPNQHHDDNGGQQDHAEHQGESRKVKRHRNGCEAGGVCLLAARRLDLGHNSIAPAGFSHLRYRRILRFK